MSWFISLTRFVTIGLTRRFVRIEGSTEVHVHWDRASRSWRPRQFD